MRTTECERNDKDIFLPNESLTRELFGETYSICSLILSLVNCFEWLINILSLKY